MVAHRAGSPRVRRRPRQAELGLNAREWTCLSRLTTTQAIQRHVDAIPINRETGGETVHSVRAVLRHREAHCIEGALVAACALWIQGSLPLLIHFDCDATDYPHVAALFRRGRHWGAISKSNHAALRYRDPVYRSLRELAMSYFHEYVDRRGRKTMRSYTSAFDLRRIDCAEWITSPTACWKLHDRLAAARHFPLLTPGQARDLASLDPFARRAAALEQYPRAHGH